MNRIIMDLFHGQIRIAITKGDKLYQYFVERETGTNNYGDIYIGRVENIKPGIQAAFVNIGSAKNALLHLSDIVENKNELSINKLLRKGQEVIVQIKKEAVGDKGARLTTRFSISGHYLVLLPTESGTFVSKKITDKDEKVRLKQGVNSVKPKDLGVIIRTEAQGVDIEVIIRELEYLLSRWKRINPVEIAPKLLLKDVSRVVKTIRDFYTDEIDEVVVNDRDVMNELREYFEVYFPQDIHKIRCRQESNLIEQYGLSSEISKLYQRKIWLKSGGYIIIDYAEACTVIDVNSGKYTGNKNIDETFLKINLDATRLIADQIRLRNISGIILIDYINVKKKECQNAIVDFLNKCLSEDKVTTKVYGFTELSILEMTRKREGKSLNTITSEKCELCDGTGLIPNQETMFYKAVSIVEKNKSILNCGGITVKVNPYVFTSLNVLREKKKSYTFIDMLKDIYKIRVVVREDQFLNTDEIKVLAAK